MVAGDDGDSAEQVTRMDLTTWFGDVTADDVTNVPETNYSLGPGGENRSNIRVPLLAVSYVFSGFHILLAGVIVFGNSLVLASFVKYHSVRTIHNLFLVSMSVSDLLTAPTLIVVDILTLFYAESQAARMPCVVAAGVLALTILGSVWNLLLVTLERYVTVVYPFRYMYLFTKPTVRAALVITWVGLIMAPIIALYDNRWYPGVRCYPMRLVTPGRFGVVGIVLLLILPVVLVTAFYLHLAIVALKHRRKIRDMLPAPPLAGAGGSNPAGNNGTATKVESSSHGRSAKRLGAVLGLLYISWIPTIVNPYYVPLARRSEALALMVAICQELGNVFMYAGPCLNPLIYHKTSKEFKSAFRKILGVQSIDPSSI